MIRRKDNKNRVLKNGEYQRKNGSYEYKWIDNKGNRHSIYASTLDALRVKSSQIEYDRYDNTNFYNKLTLNDFYKRWISLKKNRKPSTINTYKFYYNKYLKEELGYKQITKIKKSDVTLFLYSLKDKGLAKNTIIHAYSILNGILTLAEDDDLIRKNPCKNAFSELNYDNSLKVAKKDALTIDEQLHFMEFVKNNPRFEQFYNIFNCLLWTGLRIGELLGLRWEDVDFEKNTIDVNHSLYYCSIYDDQLHGRKELMINTPKTKTSNRIIPMLPEVKESLLDEKRKQIELGIVSTTVIDGYSNFIFITDAGTPYFAVNLNERIKKIIQKYNEKAAEEDKITTENITNHTFRHTFATRMCEAGINPKVIQHIMGHSEMRITLDVYTNASLSFQKEQLDNFIDYMNKKKDKNE